MTRPDDGKSLEPVTGRLVNLTPAQERWLAAETEKKHAAWRAELDAWLKTQGDLIKRAAVDDGLAREITAARFEAEKRLCRPEVKRWDDAWKECWRAIHLDDKVDEARLARAMQGDFAQ